MYGRSGRGRDNLKYHSYSLYPNGGAHPIPSSGKVTQLFLFRGVDYGFHEIITRLFNHPSAHGNVRVYDNVRGLVLSPNVSSLREMRDEERFFPRAIETSSLNKKRYLNNNTLMCILYTDRRISLDRSLLF